MLRSDLCDYSDAYIVEKEGITVQVDNIANRRKKKLTLKDNVPFRLCISKNQEHVRRQCRRSSYCYSHLKFVRI